VRALAPDLARRERDGHRAAEEREDQWMAVLLEGRRGEVFDAVCSRSPERGRGKAWIPALAQERPFAWAPEAGPPPADGAPLRLRPGRLDFHRGRVEFEPAPAA
jgi:hypothetical protein